jgi:hypothetical protein
MEPTTEVKVNIPKSLQTPENRFIKVEAKGKRAIEKKWNTEANYAWNDEELQEHITKGGNYGFLTGITDTVVIDADNKEFYDWCEENLPKTLKVKTRNGCHYYYRIPSIKQKIILKKGDEHYGEIQHKGQYVVGPNSIHPTGTTYTIIEEHPIFAYSRNNPPAWLLEERQKAKEKLKQK